MPSCFSLTKRGHNRPSNLQDVDRDICEHLGVKVDPMNWYSNWYNTIGLSLAIGHSFEKIKEFFPERAQVIDFLEQNYDVNSWKEFK